MEPQFTEEIERLKLGAGEVFFGEGILAVTKALLQSGVSSNLLNHGDAVLMIKKNGYASAICGTHFGLTNETNSIDYTPVPDRAFTNLILS